MRIGLHSDGVRFFLNRVRERLWVKPLVFSLLSVLAVFLAGMADHYALARSLPEITQDSIETLLKIISASMLVIAVFAVGAMLSAYASASSAATPRSFPLVIADDVSQNALSTFIGAFIFSLVALIALMNGYYDRGGRFLLFLVTLSVFAIVILRFVRWVDRIARLGRLGTTIDKVEAIAAKTLRSRRRHPTLGAVKAVGEETGSAVYAKPVGYVQHIDVAALQSVAENNDLRITVCALPGTFSSPGQPLAHVTQQREAPGEKAIAGIIQAFVIGEERTFDEDPRFGLIVLSEISSRALSPAVNDPGTAIDVIGTLVRLFTEWSRSDGPEKEAVEFDRVAIPEISLHDMFDDAFNATARDGAPTLEVGIRLQKAFYALASLGDAPMKEAAIAHAQFALRHAERELKLPEEKATLRNVSKWVHSAKHQHAIDRD